MPDVFGIVLAGGEGKRLAPLTADRAKPAVPFGGNYRLIDFALSNLVNAGYPPDRGPHAVQEPLAGPPHLDHLAAVAAAGQLRRAGAGADAPRAALVLGLGRRDLPEPQPALRRAPRHRGRLRRRPHLPHGPAPDGRPAHRERRGGDRRRAARAAGRGRPVRRHRDGRRRADDHRLPREAHRRRRPGRRARQGLRLDGQLRLQRRRAHRHRHARRRGRELQARHGRQHRPGARRERRGARLRLLAQRGPGRERGRARLLARRRDARRLLRRAHGPHLGRARVQPLQPRVADPHLARSAAAGQVRLRRRRRPARAWRWTRWCAPASSSPAAPCAARCSRRARTCTPTPRSRTRSLMQGVDVGRDAVVRRAIVDKNVRIAAGAADRRRPRRRPRALHDLRGRRSWSSPRAPTVAA